MMNSFLALVILALLCFNILSLGIFQMSLLDSYVLGS
jgi:hypothetical protein